MIHGCLLRADGAPGLLHESASGEQGRHGDVHVRADAWIDDRDVLAGKLDVDAESYSDPDLIAAAWARWREDFCHHLLGDFAFVLWDSSRRLVVLARDPVGVRPLHYYLDRDRVAFSSDLERLLEIPAVPRRLDESVLAATLLRPRLFMPVLSDRTCWKGVRKLPPGHRLMITPNGDSCVRWCRWEEIRDIRFKRNEDYPEALAERLGRAVRRCLTRPVKVASHLSGGMDCSTIAVLAARQLSEKGRQLAAAYTWFSGPDAFSPEGDDAWRLVADLAQQLAVPLHSVTLSPESLAALAARDFTRCSVHMLEYENQVLCHAARTGVKVILSGWGGDDVVSARSLGGWFDLLHQGRWMEAWHEFRLGTEPARKFPRALASWIYNGRLGGTPAVLRSQQKLVGYIPMPFIDADFSRQTIANPVFAPLAFPHPARGWRTRCIANLTLGYLAHRMESWANAGALHGVWYRYPMLDRELVEFCLSVPSEQTVLGGIERSLVIRAVKGLLPDAIRLRGKPKETQRVARLGAANDLATELLAKRALQSSPPRLFAWIDYDRIDRILAGTAGDPPSRFVRRQAARVALLSPRWQCVDRKPNEFMCIQSS